MTLSKDEKIKRFVEKRSTRLEKQSHTKSKLYVVLGECGWKRSGAKNLERIQSACVANGIYPEPMLTAPGLSRDELIYFSRSKPDPYDADDYSPHPTFASERALQRFLAWNLGRIPELEDLKKPIPEYQLPSGGRIDILCRERRTNAYVVLELKKQDQDPVGQIEKYLVEVDRKLARNETPRPQVKGIIITGQRNTVLERTLPDRIPDYPVTWFLYRVELALAERAQSLPASKTAAKRKR